MRNWDRGLNRAVAEANLLSPKPDFVVFGGDLGQLGKKEELDHGAEMLSRLSHKTHCVMGEHDYYLDLGEHWSKLFGPHHYSFDHKGVHFVVLNSVLTFDDWTFKRRPTAEQRMLEMAGLDNPNGSPFMVGDKHRAWLAEDLAKVGKDSPVVVFSHSPIQKIYKGWNFWTDDAEEVQALLKPFKTPTHHVHSVFRFERRRLDFHFYGYRLWNRAEWFSGLVRFEQDTGVEHQQLLCLRFVSQKWCIAVENLPADVYREPTFESNQLEIHNPLLLCEKMNNH